MPYYACEDDGGGGSAEDEGAADQDDQSGDDGNTSGDDESNSESDDQQFDWKSYYGYPDESPTPGNSLGLSLGAQGTIDKIEQLKESVSEYSPKDYADINYDLQYYGKEPAVNGNEVAREAGVGVKVGPNAAIINKIRPEIASAIQIVAEAARTLNLPPSVITSGNDGEHKPKNGSTSLHYLNLALDFRGNNISIEVGKNWEMLVKLNLGSDYDIDFEIFKNKLWNHLHVEFDPK